MTPRTLLRQAALGALSAAAALDPPDPDFAPLIGAPVYVGQSWPSQSPAPGSAPLPNQLLLYGWEEKSETISQNTTAPQFKTVLTLVVEARVETRTPAANAALPAVPSAMQIAAAIDGQLEALSFAVKKAVCQGLGVAVMALNGGVAALEEIRSIETADRLDDMGQRIAGNAALAFELVLTETFEPLIPNALGELVGLINPQAGAIPNEGNAGNGEVGPIAVGLGAQIGSYAIAFTSAAAFSVTAPDASAAGSGTVGAPFSGGGLSFTIAGGLVPFSAGDGFQLVVEVAAGNYVSFGAAPASSEFILDVTPVSGR